MVSLAEQNKKHEKSKHVYNEKMVGNMYFTDKVMMVVFLIILLFAYHCCDQI